MVQRTAARRRELGRKVKDKRLSMGMSKDEAAHIGRMSPVTWTRVEDGETVRDLSYFGVSRALGWAHSACIGFLERGVDPVADEDRISGTKPEASDVVTLRAVLTEMEPAELAELIARAAEIMAEKQSPPEA